MFEAYIFPALIQKVSRTTDGLFGKAPASSIPILPRPVHTANCVIRDSNFYSNLLIIYYLLRFGSFRALLVLACTTKENS